jgi:hypothetical protein
MLALQGCSRESDHADVQFAKTTFFSMVNGTAAESAIDWETFRVANEDVGAQYRALLNDAEKAEFRKSFLVGLSASTPNLKAKPSLVTHWRVKSENPSETIVAADMTHQDAVILFTVSKRSGTQKISSFEIK